MARPTFLKPPAQSGESRLDSYVSPNNRQNVNFELPVAVFMRAKSRISQRHDEARKKQQAAGIGVSKAETFDVEKYHDEMRDYDICRNYKHHFTDMRGNGTVKRSNIVVKK